MLKLFELIYLIVPAVVGVLAVERRRRRGDDVDRAERVRVFLFWYLVLAVGAAGLLDGFSQMFDPDATADLNDWPESQAFIELGMMNFSFGVLGICCIWAKGSWRYAAGVGYSIFLLLAAYYHLHDAYGNGNHSDGNTGPSLWSDIGVATILLVLIWLDSRERRQEPAISGDR